MNIEEIIATELQLTPAQVHAAVNLLDNGDTVPFIARYRKEATGGLNDTDLRRLEERLAYLRSLEDRRRTILRSIEEQGKLTAALKEAILAARDKTRLEDLYAPYKPKRRTRAQIAREAGLEPLLEALLHDSDTDPDTQAVRFINADKGVNDASSALEGARYIFMERAADHADLIGELREYTWEHGHLQARVVDGKEKTGAKFADYFAFQQPLKAIPSHRALALFRGRTEGVLRLKVIVSGQDEPDHEARFGHCEQRIAEWFGITAGGRAADPWRCESVRWAWRVKIAPQLETDLLLRLREAAEEEAIRVFGENLRDLLLAAPAGPRAVMGLDPGLRTGVKVAVVDATGKLLASDTIYPHPPRKQAEAAMSTLLQLITAHDVDLISIGNGTGSRETDRFVKAFLDAHPQLKVQSIIVNEAGASVYSASELAAKEFPDLDVSIRGAVSIARRLQDPLAELVKIDPKAIGVGQYQHDVNQTRLARKLDAVVEDCVNAVGVDVNTASPALLRRIAGLGDMLAENIVAHRNRHGAFRNRNELLKVQRLGPKAFEQAAGFLRIYNGDNPLDASAVHPEAYPVVERILKSTGKSLREIIGDQRFLSGLAANDFTDDRFGEPTVRDLLQELEKPGRDPRPEFKSAHFNDNVATLGDLKPGMLLQGVVTNVTNFGAFVDIGVHQDGLVHISALADKFVKDPREIVKTGAVVNVKVIDIDTERRRIGLSMRLADPAQRDRGTAQPAPKKPGRKKPRQTASRKQPPRPMNSLQAAFDRLKNDLARKN